MLVAAALAGGPALLPAHADDLKNKHKKAERAVKAAKAHLEDSSAALSNATKRLRAAQAGLVKAQANLAKTQGELTAARALDAQMQAKLVGAQAALSAAVADVKAGELKVASQKDALAQAAVASFSYGDPNLMKLAVVLKGTDPNDMVVQLNALDNVLDAENQLLDEYKAAQVLLQVQRDKVKLAEQAVADQRQDAAINLARKQALEKKAVAARTAVVRLVAQRRGLAAAAAKARARDKQILAASKKREAKIQRQILERARKQKNGGSYSGANDGFLYRPVPGYITSPYGYRVHPIYGYYSLHDGDDFHAPCGTPERAGASGRVISEYYSDVWGNRLYLDVGRVNGKHMTLIYNHISSYKARTGDRVGRGDVVAYAGTTGCHLHFTVLLDGKAVNPQNYM
ncbi:peptidoglycan DD-metalloendopeptidase family protein [Marmoricola sp. OAE513]|uniref:peptidoglycan DD-metalloendopeptidase family protein n=1 Tax=Marmoricola sp. OAE513 TaxID=2817894 RepID=UPI00339A65F2